MPRTVIVGLDIGQRRDPTALAVVESLVRRTGRTVHVDHEPPFGICERCEPETEDVFEVRDIGRLKLGTRYPAVARNVVEAITSLNERGVRPFLLLDVTGVGRPVFDIIEGALADADVALSAVTFTSGAKMRGALGAPNVSMPKELLVSRLQALLQTGRIRMPDNRRTPRPRRGTPHVRGPVTERTANLTAGAFRTGAHDDMATALGLAVLFDPSGQRVTYSPYPWS